MNANINANLKQSKAQKRMILNHLMAGMSITSLEAIKDFGCTRLAARIHELKDEGYDIKSEFVKMSKSKKVKLYYI